MPTMIPALSYENLNFMDNDLESPPWKENFYERLIRLPVKDWLENSDFSTLSEVDQITALQDFVNNWSEVKFKNESLVSNLEAFDAVSTQSLPGKVTRKLHDDSMKECIKLAYQNLILLEVVYYIENLMQNTPEFANKAAINHWITSKKAALKPQAPSFLKLKEFDDNLFQLRNTVFWFLQNLPSIVRLFFRYHLRGAKTASYFKNSWKQMSLSLLQTLLFPLSILLKVSLFAYMGANNLFNMSLLLLKKTIFRNVNWAYGSKVINLLKHLFLIYMGSSFLLPYILPVMGYSMGIYLASYVIGGASIFLLRHIFKDHPHYKLSEEEQANPYLLKEELATLIFYTLFTMSDYRSRMVKELFSFCVQHQEKLIEFFERSMSILSKLKQIDNAFLDMTEDMRREREAILADTTAVIDDFEAFQQSTHLTGLLAAKAIGFTTDTVAIYKPEILTKLRSKLKLAAPSSEPIHLDETYDLNQTIAEFTRLKSELAQNSDPNWQELAELVRSINPVAYCYNHRQTSELPELLRPYVITQKPRQAPSS